MEVFLEISLIIAIAAAIALVMQLLRQPLVLGHIITGIVVGPAVLNIIHSKEAIEVFSHLGITALLFIVGLSLSPRVIREVGKVALIAGLGQVIFTTAIGYGIGAAFGFAPMVSLFLAVAFTFSSTIIISKLLSDKHDTNKLYGKIAIGMLLVQDVAATVVLIAIASSAAGGGVASVLINTAFKGILVGGSLYITGIYILPALTSVFAKSQEFLFLFSIGWGLGIAAIFYVLGLSVELGALAAGITLASSPYHYEISAKMKLLRDFFIVMFFVLLGSQLSAPNIMEFFWPILAFSAFIIIGNPLIVMIIMGLMGYAKKTSFRAGLTMAQISEFSLIIIILAIQAGYIPAEYLTLATIVGIVTIAASAIMIICIDKLYYFFAPILGIFERKHVIPARERKETYDIILFGCHRVGSDFLPSVLKLKQSYLVIDFDPQVVEDLKKRGIHAMYGDAEDNEMLEEIRLDKTKMVISTIPDFEANAFLVSKIRKVNKRAVIITIAQRIKEAQKFYGDGASYVVMPHHMGGNYGAMLIAKHGHDRKKYDAEKTKHLKHLEDRYRQIVSPDSEAHYLKVTKERI